MLKLKDWIGRHSEGSLEDILPVKNSLKSLGLYKEPNYGMTEYPDEDMFNGISTFQQRNKLKVDGVMKPGGETESKMNEALQSATHMYGTQPSSKSKSTPTPSNNANKNGDTSGTEGSLMSNMLTGLKESMGLLNGQKSSEATTKPAQPTIAKPAMPAKTPAEVLGERPAARMPQQSPLSRMPQPQKTASATRQGSSQLVLAQQTRPKTPEEIDEDIISRNRNVLINDEANGEIIPYPYFDSVGKKTVGIGTNIDNYDDFKKMNWSVSNGRPPSQEDVLQGFNKLEEIKASLPKEIKNGKEVYNYKASYFKDKTNLRLGNNDVENIYKNRAKQMLKEHRNRMARLGIDWDNEYPEVQDASFDMLYNMGSTTFSEHQKNGFPNFFAGWFERDYEKMANESHRFEISPERNERVRQLLLQAAAKHTPKQK